MPEKWKLELARNTFPRIAQALGKIAKEIERYNDSNETSEVSDEAVVDLSELRDEISERRKEKTRERLNLEDENDSLEETQTAAWYRGQEDAYHTVTRIIDARLENGNEEDG